ncbi:MAG: 3-methyladenine DNA glycosylase [Verrucomicrobiota bacterium]
MNLILSKADWQNQRESYREQVSGWTVPHRERRFNQIKHPTRDFLFDYYSFRASLLERWSPGWGTTLLEASPSDFPGIEGWMTSENGIQLSLENFPAHRMDSFRWMIQFLKITLDRAPQYGCYGLHEWAMVYRIDQARHTGVPLRMSPDDLAAFVESQSLCCTHHDAFRFYTPEARPLNRHDASKANRFNLEQPGCIHVNMDLYKWAYKFYPWTPSQWILEAFELAMDARLIDMQASPYDLREWKIEPIRIETPEGKLEYIESQRRIHQKGIPLRQKLRDFYVDLLHAVKEKDIGLTQRHDDTTQKQF